MHSPPTSASTFAKECVLCVFLLFFVLMVQMGSAHSEDEDEALFQYLQQLNKRSPMKKSDGLMSDFIGSLNGAARLRYGKRSSSRMSTADIPLMMQYYRQIRPFGNRWRMAKRVAYAEALPAGLLDQLNGAERLRFGRK